MDFLSLNFLTNKKCSCFIEENVFQKIIMKNIKQKKLNLQDLKIKMIKFNSNIKIFIKILITNKNISIQKTINDLYKNIQNDITNLLNFKPSNIQIQLTYKL